MTRQLEGCLDYINVLPVADGGSEIMVFGWILDHHEEIQSLLVTINKGLPSEIQKTAHYGLPRADVRAVLPHVPHASTCGFQVLFQTPGLRLEEIKNIEGAGVLKSGVINRMFAIPRPKTNEERLADVELPSKEGKLFGFLDNVSPCYAGEGRTGLVARGWIAHNKKRIVGLTLLAEQSGETVVSTEVKYGLEHIDLVELLRDTPQGGNAAFRAVFQNGDFKTNQPASFLARITLDGGQTIETRFASAIVPDTMTTLAGGLRLAMNRPRVPGASPVVCYGNVAAIYKVWLGKGRIGYYVSGWLLTPKMQVSDVWLEAEGRRCDIFHFGYPHHSLENAYPNEKGSKGWFSGLLLDQDWHAGELRCRITGRTEKGEEFFLEFPSLPVDSQYFHRRDDRPFPSERKSVGVYQLFYSDESKDRLDPGFIPYFNDRISRFFENEVIVELIGGEKHSASDYFGVFSWRFSEKIPLRSEIIFDLMNEDGYEADVYTFFEGIHSGLGEVGHNTWLFGECSHPGLIEAGEALLSRLGIRLDLRTLTGPIIYQNHFICRSGVYEKYVRELLEPAIRTMSDLNDREIQDLVGRDAQYISRSETAKHIFGRPYFSLEPFICERLFSIWAALQSLKVRHIFCAKIPGS